MHVPLLKVCGPFLFQQSNKTCGILWSVRVFFTFLEVRRLNKYFLWEANLVFYTQIFGLIWQSVNLSWKTAVWRVGCVFIYFCGGHKNNVRLCFRSSFNNNLWQKLVSPSEFPIIFNDNHKSTSTLFFYCRL